MDSGSAPDVSVIIPAYNGMPYFIRCIESVVGQTLGLDRMEVVIVDDGSSDGTGEEADRWAEKHPEVFRVLHEQGSGGPAKPRNTGLDVARGRYVFFLDADDYLGTEALERLLRAAEENDSDIVLGRMRSDSIRGVPASMYAQTDLDADLYTSRVWWTLAALKLFRRDLLEDNAIRFPTHFPNCSDQPFTGTAYLRARKISVLSDYDYYYVVARDDDMHVTSSGSVSNRIDVVEAMCDLLEREVPDPVKRAPLLTRHFQIDLRTVMQRIEETPSSEQGPLFERVVALVRTHLTPEIARRLGNNMQVIYHLTARGMLDEALVAVVHPWTESTYDVTIEGDRVFAHLPFFRDPGVGVPDDCYDVTSRTNVHHALTSYSWTGTTLHLAGTAGLRHATPTMDDTVEILLRSRQEPDEDFVVGATRLPDNGFEAALDLLSIDGGGALANGFYDVFVRVSRDGYVSTARFGGRGRPEDLPTDPSLHYAAVGDEPWTATSYFTDYGNLSLDVGQRKYKLGQSIRDWAVSWDGTDLIVGGVLDLEVHGPLAVVLVGDDQELTFPLRAEVGEFAGRVPVTEVPDGRWAVRFRLGVAPAYRGFAVPAKGQLEPVSWRRALVPSYARPEAGAKRHLFLEVGRVDVVRGAARVARRTLRRDRG
jgi:poly(ribitol-phosphate) beta-N-acetylglucosaminyltransferase